MQLSYTRVDQKSTPVNKAQRREIVRLRDVEGLSWRQIAERLSKRGKRISFQRVCQLYATVKQQSGQVNAVKLKEVIEDIKVKRTKFSPPNPKVKTKDLTPEAIDRLINLDHTREGKSRAHEHTVFELEKK